MISLHYTSHTKAYNTIYTACNIVEAIYSFTGSPSSLAVVRPRLRGILIIARLLSPSAVVSY